MNRFGVLVALLVVLLAWGPCFAQVTGTLDHSPASKFRTPPGRVSMPMVAPLFLDDKDFSSTVTLVNDAIARMSARVVVLDSSGVQVAFKEVVMPGHTSLPIQIRDLLTEAGSAANSGSVLLIPQPAPGMPIGAQLSIASKTGTTPAYIEEEMLPQDEGRQGIYRAAALAVKGSPIVALKSLGQSIQSVTLQCFSEKTAPTKGTVQVLPGQLLLVAACDTSQIGLAALNDQMFNDQIDRGSTGVGVSTTGTPGDLVTFGFSIYNDERGPYFSSLNFTNPTEQLSSSTIFTGIPVGAADPFPRTVFHPEVAVSNFSIRPAEVTITLAHTIAGKTSTEVVQRLVLAGQSSQTVQIPAHGDPAMTNSLIVRSSLPPGNVVSQFIAWGDFQVRSVELQAKDNDSVQNGGGHPWTIAQGADSTLLLFNHSLDGPKKFEVLIGNGKQLWVGSYSLASMETKAVKINEIVEKQIPDAKGAKLSKDILTGQVGWWTHRAKWGKGRLMVSQPQMGMARSFSCGSCAALCFDAALNPHPDLAIGFDVVGVLGDVTISQCIATCGECGGTLQGPGSGFITWSSGNPSIAALYSGQHSLSASFKGMATGTTTGNVSVTDEGCTEVGSGPITVLSAVVSLNDTGQVSSTDGAATLYKGVVGTLNLGLMAGTLGVNNGCVAGNELVGAVTPSTFIGSVTVKRTLVSIGCYLGSNPVTCPAPGDDTGDLITTDPQEQTPGGSAAGHVYNLDTPGVLGQNTTTPIRLRANFTAYAVGPDGVTQISNSLNYYVKISCVNNSSGVAQLSTDVTGDNQIGSGTTKTTWNLQ